MKPLQAVIMYYFNIFRVRIQHFLKFLCKDFTYLYDILTFFSKSDKIYVGMLCGASLIYRKLLKGGVSVEYFSRLFGNEKTKSHMANAILKNTLPHAFLITGARGSGKKTLAYEIAAALNCENRVSGTTALPCHSCNNCRRIKEGLFPDVHTLRRDEKKMSIGVDEIEAMRSDIILSSTESDFRIYIIDEANRITPQAQNSMLKVLEEPPLGVIIILLAEEADKILTTIKSRVQSIAMERFSKEVLHDYLIEKSERARFLSRSEPEGLEGIIMASDGRIGTALTLLDDGDASASLKARRALTEEFVNALFQNTSYRELLGVVKELPGGRVEYRAALEEIASALRDLTVLKYDKGAPLLFYTSRKEAMKICEKMTAKRLFALYDLIKASIEDNAKNANMGVQNANLCAKIKLI